MSDPRPILTLAHSPDPDDAFMWWPITGKVSPDGTRLLEPPVMDTGRFRYRAVPADIQALNARARQPEGYDVTALSFRAFADVADRYVLCRVGSSFGDGFGPKVVAPRGSAHVRCEGCLSKPHVRVAIPGFETSAFLTLALFLGGQLDRSRFVPMPFDRVIPSVARGRGDDGGEVHAGLVIHEGQVLFEQAGLRKVLDVGEWWKEETSLPLPLGANALRLDLEARHGMGTLGEVSRTLAQSLAHALAHRGESLEYTRPFAHANALRSQGLGGEPTLEQIDRYVSLYVNRWTGELDAPALEAITRLFEAGARAGLCPRVPGLRVV